MNNSKPVVSSSTINILGYLIGNGIIKPDPDRLRPLQVQEHPPPTSVCSLLRLLGTFAYYAKWIPDFSEKFNPLTSTQSFPFSQSVLNTFTILQKELAAAALVPIDESMPFVVECDASGTTLSPTLNQGGRPVAFMSKTLQGSELHHTPVEKEATAIVEVVRKWSHFSTYLVITSLFFKFLFYCFFSPVFIEAILFLILNLAS